MSNLYIPRAAAQSENAAARAQREAGNPHDKKPETPCEFVRAIESVEVEMAHRASADDAGELATAYWQVVFLLRREVRRHVRGCAVCQEHEAAVQTAAEVR
jgi:hypothetical protein